MARGWHRSGFLVLILSFGAVFSVLADSSKTLESYRTSFEKRLNTELDEHGAAARELRTKYLEALKKLKLELGRSEKLSAAAQVVAEIEAVEDGKEPAPLPKDADFKFSRLRLQWENGLGEIQADRAGKLRKTVGLYLKALDTEKRKLTRAGKIKEALLFEEEETRVNALPEVIAVLTVEEDPEDEPLEEFLVNTRWQHSVSGRAAPSGVIRFSRSGRGEYKEGTVKLKWEVTGKNKVSVTSEDWESPLLLTFNKDRSKYEGRMGGDGLKRTGSRVDK